MNWKQSDKAKVSHIEQNKGETTLKTWKFIWEFSEGCEQKIICMQTLAGKKGRENRL